MIENEVKREMKKAKQIEAKGGPYHHWDAFGFNNKTWI